MSENAIVQNRDYTLIIDKSNSMAISDVPGGKTRWQAARESTLALARECEKIDPDGITVYLFSRPFRRYDNVTAEKVVEIYANNEPMGHTNLAGVLADALDNFFERKSKGQLKPNGETILVITDGEPDDRRAVVRLLIEASKKIERDEELAISLIQVGKDKQATEFLKALDEKLQGIGAKFDIVDTISIEQMENMTLTEVLLKAITD